MARPGEKNEVPNIQPAPQGQPGPTPVKQEFNPHDVAAGSPRGPLGIIKQGRPTTPQQALAPMMGGAPGNAPGMSDVDQRADRIIGAEGSVIGTVVGMLPPSESAQAVKEPTRWRVTNGGYVTIRGERCVLRPGKELDDRSYDIKGLKAQGIRLEEVKVDDEYFQGGELEQLPDQFSQPR